MGIADEFSDLAPTEEEFSDYAPNAGDVDLTVAPGNQGLSRRPTRTRAGRNVRETGNVSRVIEVPGFDFSVGPGDGGRWEVTGESEGSGPARTTEFREIKVEETPEDAALRRDNMLATIRRERERDPGALAERAARAESGGRPLVPWHEGPRRELGGLPDYLVPDSVGGRELPSEQSVRRVGREMGRGNLDPRNLIDVLLPRENTAQPIVGYDLRDRAPAYGASNLFGATDELIGLVRGDEARERDIARRDRAREQAPGSYAIGQQAENIPLMLLPGGQGTALERMAVQGGYGLGAGALRGFMENDEGDVGQRLNSAAREGVNEALLSGGMQGAGEVAEPLLRAAARNLPRLTGSVEDAAARNRMAASGLNPSFAPRTRYGRHVERLGGPREVARMLDEERIGGRFLPSPNDVPESVERLGADVGRQFEEVMGGMEAAGREGRVPMRPFVEGVEQSARGLETLETGPANRAAQTMRSDFIEPRLEPLPPDVEGPRDLRNPTIPFRDAHSLRRHLDRVSNAFGRASDPAAESAAGAADEARDVLQRLMNESIEAADPARNPAALGALRDFGSRSMNSTPLSETWRTANRRASLQALLEQNSRAGGGLFAPSTAEGVGTALAGPLAGQAARLQQGAANRYGPALRARGLRLLANRMRNMGPRFQRFADVLEQATQRGSTALAAAHLRLSRQSPEYRAAVERMQNEEQE